MKKYVYILLLASSSLLASKFIIQNDTKYSLNGVFAPTNVVFSLKPDKKKTYERGSIKSFTIFRNDDPSMSAGYIFTEANQDQDMKFIVKEVPGKGAGKKMLQITFQSMPSRSNIKKKK